MGNTSTARVSFIRWTQSERNYSLRKQEEKLLHHLSLFQKNPYLHVTLRQIGAYCIRILNERMSENGKQYMSVCNSNLPESWTEHRTTGLESTK